MRRRLTGIGLVGALVVLLSTVTPEVSAAPSPQAGPSATTVVVTLKDQADLASLRAPTRRKRLAKVLLALQTKADDSQVGLRAELDDLAAQHKVSNVEPLWISNSVAVTATPDAVAQLADRADVASVVPDEITIIPSAGPPEPNQELIRAREVWETGHTGQGAVVASLDSGVDGAHPDLVDRWRGGANSWFDPYGQHPTTPTDLSGHGTGVTGAMVGGDAGGTSIGTAPGASWIAARVFDDAGRATVSAIHQAFQWVLDPDHDPTTNDAPQVVNGSWSIGSAPSCDLSFQPDVQALRAAGILPVFAAGNFGSKSSTSASPANYPESLSVGAVANTGLIYYASSRGPSTCGGRTRVFPDVVAPGVSVYTTDRYDFYQYLSGTSIAAPHVAGTLALLLSTTPGLTADQQQAAITTTARDLGATGPDDIYGSGLVDAMAAYQSLGEPPPPPPPDFGVQVAPTQANLVAGESATFAVQVTPVNGFVGDVALTLTGLDAPSSASFSPQVVAGGAGGSTLTVLTTPTFAPGNHALTVTATSGATSHSAVLDLSVTAPPPPPPPPPADRVYFSTLGNTNPPGVPGTADDADIYSWNGTFSRLIDASGTGSLLNLPAGANVDGYDRVDDTHFYLSFSTDTTIQGLGAVQDEDVVYYNAGVWSVFFDGTAHGMTAANLDLDAISIDNGTLYFSTFGNTNPPGAGGTADDADIYRYNGGNSYTRIWDATAKGLPGSANVDGYVRVDDTHFYLSFSPTTVAVPGLGNVPDEDVVYNNNGTWAVYFDGTSRGLTAANQDVDAFDVPAATQASQAAAPTSPDRFRPRRPRPGHPPRVR